ncbi:alpha/beta fold hydrolase [Rhizobium leguminosarum]|uniref:alpha/beta fold hydrolase n=1 Tax=Rhizobium leguminosarum TaxID=384 RepID=UPI00103FF353|nr:alpha/beta hydrolase [Rhizobium leguminosarum]MDV4165049.1 alpha/beta hydrolase [Rhizobium leguminosarum]MDV4175583.1 alpha/beta hydrolase [Rhizobium leguminosarum]TCA89909.1 alpha/beta fold hydrolase [Rhizobium leguminosarum bv. viciae]TCB01509.1 alpha/beta fold hydrolase [Rhizobium leguminosarum bv. viciae]
MRRARPFETSDGTILNVDMAGEGASAIFQHGLCGDAAQTDEVFPLEAGFRRVTIEARGHGHSQAGNLERLSIATFCDDIAAYIEKNLTPPIVIGGISMGAAIALRLAVKRPDLVKALIIARPAWLTAPEPENMAPNAEVGRLLKTLPPDEAKTTFLAGPVGVRLAAEAPDNLASLAGFFSRTPLDVTAELLTRISNGGPDVTDEEVGNIAVPTLIIGHDRDSIHPLGHACALAERIAGARFVQITSKTVSRPQYVADFRLAMGHFLKEL